jgi:DNA-directed RNA polymerase specialized sigma24 family protein
VTRKEPSIPPLSLTERIAEYTMTTNLKLLQLAGDTLTTHEYQVWIAKHYQGLGRRTGSLTLGITEEAWRYRLATATRKLDAAIQAEKDAA